MKVGLTLILVLTIAAGPWLCCCTAGQLAAVPNAPANQDATPPCCCPHEPHAQMPTEAPATPAQPCSCNDERQPAVAVSATSVDLAQAAQVLDRLDVCPNLNGSLAAGVLPSLSLPLQPGSIAFPFQSARDILRAVQALRC